MKKLKAEMDKQRQAMEEQKKQIEQRSAAAAKAAAAAAKAATGTDDNSKSDDEERARLSEHLIAVHKRLTSSVGNLAATMSGEHSSKL